jgi:hypothetical protein
MATNDFLAMIDDRLKAAEKARHVKKTNMLICSRKQLPSRVIAYHSPRVVGGGYLCANDDEILAVGEQWYITHAINQLVLSARIVLYCDLNGEYDHCSIELAEFYKMQRPLTVRGEQKRDVLSSFKIDQHFQHEALIFWKDYDEAKHACRHLNEEAYERESEEWSKSYLERYLDMIHNDDLEDQW